MNKNISTNDIDTREFTKKDNEQVTKLIGSISDFTNEDILSYGIAQQKKLAEISNELFKQAKLVDTSVTLECIDNIDKSVNNIGNKFDLKNIGKLSSDLLTKIKQEYTALLSVVDKNIEILLKELRKCKERLTVYSNLLEKNNYYMNQIGIYIKAGEKWLSQITQDVSVFFERKIKDLKVSRKISVGTNNQLEKLSNIDKVLIDKIIKSFEDIKAWKNQVNELIYLAEEAKGATL